MSLPKFEPEKITNPIALFAFILAVLAALEWVTLSAAQNISDPSWIRPMLSIAAVLYVPAFLIGTAVIIKQIRHHLQADPHYSRAEERKYGDLLVTSEEETSTETESPVKDLEVKVKDTIAIKDEAVAVVKRGEVNFTKTTFELIPSRRRVSKGDFFSLDCVISGLGDRQEPTLGGFTLVLLWNRYQVELDEIAFTGNLGGEKETIRNYHILKPGQFNPADPEFAAIVFSEHTKLSAEELTRIQPHSPVIATFVFKSLADGPIIFNAGFPYGQNSLIDANRIPSFKSNVKALFLNQKSILIEDNWKTIGDIQRENGIPTDRKIGQEIRNQLKAGTFGTDWREVDGKSHIYEVGPIAESAIIAWWGINKHRWGF